MAKILLIEDNLEIRENTAELLGLEGHIVLEASNGRRGLDIAIEQVPDIIICDIMMPEMNGYEVFEALKKSGSTSRIPFIFLTASVEKKSVQTAFELGVTGYIRKPYEADELMGEIKRCLGH